MKALKIISIILVVFVLVVGISVSFFLGSIIKTSVETIGPQVMGVDVTLDSARFKLLKGEAHLGGLVVGNPEGFKTDSAFELGSIDIKMKPSSLFSDTIVIEKIHIHDPSITMEGSLTGSNIKKLLKQVGGEEDAGEGEDPKETASGKKMLIEEFILDGADINLSLTILQGVAVPVPLPPVKLKNLGEDNPVGIDDILMIIIGSVDNAIIGAVKNSGVLMGKAAGLAVDGAVVVGGAAVHGATAVGGAAVQGVTAVGGAAVDGVSAVGGAAADVVGGTAGLAVDGVKGVGKGAGKLLGGMKNLVTGGDDDVKE